MSDLKDTGDLKDSSKASDGDAVDDAGFSFVDMTLESDVDADAVFSTPEDVRADAKAADVVSSSGAVSQSDGEDVYDFVNNGELSSSRDIAVQGQGIQKASEASKAEDGYTGRIRIGDRLVEMGIITSDQLNVALQEQRISGKMLGEALLELAFVDEDTLTIVLAQTAGFEVFDPKSTIFDGDALAMLEKADALRLKMLPVSLSGDELSVALVDPYDVINLDSLKRKIPRGVSVKPLVATATIVSEAIDAAYGYASNIDDILKELEGVEDSDLTELSDNEAYTHPIVRLVNALLFEAVKLGVSDLHFEPEENFIRLRYRLDGVLFTSQILHKKHWNGISQRIKIMSTMNIADKLSPQDGRFNLNVGGREADFRVSSLPTVHGENIVLRVLDKSASIMPLEALGFSESNLELIKLSQTKPEGIIIVTGPTGSGKSTSLYSMLNAINDVAINIQTLEDPVEYSLPMIRQTYVREGILDFADGIKALLRQDPDIIFIGEIRDKTTAEMALKAAMTGHQVYTTLHTNDSFGAIPRMLDLGLKPGMISGAVTSIFAQRLARRLCSECKVEYTASAEECALLHTEDTGDVKIFKASDSGCAACGDQGYKGRVAVVEILMFDEALNDVVSAGGSKADLKTTARENGFKSMADDGRLKVLEGVSSIDAVSKVVSL